MSVGTDPPTVNRYDPVNSSWPATIPPCSWDEADRARRKLVRHFNIRRWHHKTRRCWTSSPKTSGALSRGWRRLAHDLSHGWFATVYPKRKPHDPLHVWYEQQIISYIVAKGWLEGRLKR
jgi:hypothetical protein